MFKVRVEIRLGPAELVFLLEDMLRKLDFRLTAGPAKKAPFVKVQTPPNICRWLIRENICFLKISLPAGEE